MVEREDWPLAKIAATCLTAGLPVGGPVDNIPTDYLVACRDQTIDCNGAPFFRQKTPWQKLRTSWYGCKNVDIAGSVGWVRKLTLEESWSMPSQIVSSISRLIRISRRMFWAHRESNHVHFAENEELTWPTSHLMFVQFFINSTLKMRPSTAITDLDRQPSIMQHVKERVNWCDNLNL